MQSVEWRDVMSTEFNALIANNTWSLVPPNKAHYIVGNKWVFWIKNKPDGSVERFKTRLVAKGFHQWPGINFKDTFRSVLKPSTIHIILLIDISNGWKLNQLDNNNTFLQGHLIEEVFVKQPSGFIDQDKKNYVCKLQRAIYGLKQAPRAWYRVLSMFLLNFGFQNTLVDASLLVYKK